MLDKLKNINKNLPSKYFEALPEKVLDQVSDIDIFDFDEEAPILKRLGKETGFKVPSDYFNNFKVDLKQKPEAFEKIVYMKRIFLAAASVALIAACLFALSQPLAESSEFVLEDTEELSDSELLAYFEEENVDTEELLLESIEDFDVQLSEIDITELIEENLDEFGISDLETLF